MSLATFYETSETADIKKKIAPLQAPQEYHYRFYNIIARFHEPCHSTLSRIMLTIAVPEDDPTDMLILSSHKHKHERDAKFTRILRVFIHIQNILSGVNNITFCE